MSEDTSRTPGPSRRRRPSVAEAIPSFDQMFPGEREAEMRRQRSASTGSPMTGTRVRGLQDDPGPARQVGEFSLDDFTNAIADAIRASKEELPKTKYGEVINIDRSVEDLYQRMGSTTNPAQRKELILQEYNRLGLIYIDNPTATNADLLRRLDFIKKIQIQNEAYASVVKGEQKVPKGFTPTSTFSSEKITGVANDGSPIGKIISFTNGIDQIVIKADGNGGYYGIQAGQRYGPRTYKEIERWAYLGGFQAREMKELKNVLDTIKDPEKLRAVVFKARKL